MEPQQSTAAAETGAEKRRLAMAAKTAAVLKIANSLTLDTIPSASLNEYRDLFDRIDEDGSGLVEPPELKQQFAKIGLDIDGVRHHSCETMASCSERLLIYAGKL